MMDNALKPSTTPQPTKMVVHGSLVLVQLLFGAAGVIASLGLPACNPFAFALYREITAGFILLLAAVYMTSSSSKNDNNNSIHDDTLRNGNLLERGVSNDEDAKHQKSLKQTIAWLPWDFHQAGASQESLARLLALGLAIFGNQAFAIVGLKLAGPVACAVWQPSQPIITAALCMIMGWEPFQFERLMGVLLAFGGCVTMVVMSTKQATASVDDKDFDNSNSSEQDLVGLRSLLGNCFFFMNCLCTALYVIISKPALRMYPSIFVAAWSYNIAAVFMAVAAWSAAQMPSFMNLVCPDCSSIWNIPQGAYFALFYYIFFNSVIAYAVFTWANQFATGTLVMGFTVLQPVTAATLTLFLLAFKAFPSCFDSTRDPSKACLEPPGFGTVLGMFGVFVGLFFVISTEPKINHKKDEEERAVRATSQRSLIKRTGSRILPNTDELDSTQIDRRKD